jgi:sec-independent protein translocase protein TatB
MNLGFSELAFLFVLALMLFGPRKLPQIGREIGKVLGEFKRASNDFKNQLESEVSQLDIVQQRDYYRKRAEELARETQQAFSLTPEKPAAPAAAVDCESPYPPLPPAPAAEPVAVVESAAAVGIAVAETAPQADVAPAVAESATTTPAAEPVAAVAQPAAAEFLPQPAVIETAAAETLPEPLAADKVSNVS